ncbi:hypothetical protein MDA_GLEAN10021462 [Myotis davidii]|uniref:Uncharacterized protein n=1 Tax=Myotis davidii TaxID=225400 RepID=L5LSF1_MYODS|nr:hypothetical protein MDA_GLEAN10021462 [Myotis davidii]
MVNSDVAALREDRDAVRPACSTLPEPDRNPDPLQKTAGSRPPARMEHPSQRGVRHACPLYSLARREPPIRGATGASEPTRSPVLATRDQPGVRQCADHTGDLATARSYPWSWGVGTTTPRSLRSETASGSMAVTKQALTEVVKMPVITLAAEHAVRGNHLIPSP